MRNFDDNRAIPPKNWAKTAKPPQDGRLRRASEIAERLVRKTGDMR
jgi:hypothetical protein